MKSILLLIWQLPQNLIGLAILLINRRNYKKDYVYIKGCGEVTYYLVKHIMDRGISLGNYIVLDSDAQLYYHDVRHEYGHQIQSRYLGWFYLILIGIPSVCGNIIDMIVHKSHRKDCWYYRQPWERWADKLGGVKR